MRPGRLRENTTRRAGASRARIGRGSSPPREYPVDAGGSRTAPTKPQTPCPSTERRAGRIYASTTIESRHPTPVGGAFLRPVPRVGDAAARRGQPPWLFLLKSRWMKRPPLFRFWLSPHINGRVASRPCEIAKPRVLPPSFRRKPESRVWFMTTPAGTIPPPCRNRSRICPHLRLSGLPANARESAARRRRRTHGFRNTNDDEGVGVAGARRGVFRPAPFSRRQFRRGGRIAESVIFPSASARVPQPPDCGSRRSDARAPSAS